MSTGFQDVIDAITDAITCQRDGCTNPIPEDGPSDDFCGAICQQQWHEAQCSLFEGYESTESGSDWLDRAAVAQGAYSLVVLRRLACDVDEQVRCVVGSNHNITIDLVEQLARDPHWRVRAEVTANPVVSHDVLAALSADDTVWVRGAVAESPLLPADLAELLTADPEEHVRERLAANHATPPSVLIRLARSSETVSVRMAVGMNASCPPEVRDRLADRDRSPYVRRWANGCRGAA